MQLLETCDSLLQKWRTVFSQERTLERARRLTFGRWTGLRVHRTSPAIGASGRQFQDGSADYRVGSRSPWEPRPWFAVVWDHRADRLPSSAAPVWAALDDTILQKTGRRIPGVKVLRDPRSPPFQVNFCYGLRFVPVSALVSPRHAVGPARARPVRFDFAPPAHKPNQNAPAQAWEQYQQEQKTRTLWWAGVDAIVRLRARLDQRPATRDRPWMVSGDGSYTNRNGIRRLPERTPYIGPARKDVKRHYALPASSPKPQGRPRRYGPVAPTPEEVLKDPSIPVVKVPCLAAGQLRDPPVKVLRLVYWRKTGADMPLQWVGIQPLGYRLRKGSKLLYRPSAFLVCTDPDLDLAMLVQAYIHRWEIECNHRDEKSLLGVAQGQVWNPNSVRRLPALPVAGYSLLLLASILSSGFQRTDEYLPLPKWRNKSIRPSLLDLLALLRDQIFATAVDSPVLIFDDFASAVPPASKQQKQPLASETLCTVAA